MLQIPLTFTPLCVKINTVSGKKWREVEISVRKWCILMFMGQYNHTVDTKGRLIVPVKFREELGDHFVVTRGLENCLSVYSMADWKKFEEKLAQLPMTNPNARKFVRFMVSGASECELDKMGRILLPQPLRQVAGISKNVVLSGNLDHVEIWDQEKWIEADTYTDEDRNGFAENMGGFAI